MLANNCHNASLQQQLQQQNEKYDNVAGMDAVQAMKFSIICNYLEIQRSVNSLIVLYDMISAVDWSDYLIE